MQQVQAELDSRPANSYHTDSTNVGDIPIVDFHLNVGYTFDTDKNKCEERLRRYFIDKICNKLNFYDELKNILCKEI